MIYLRNTGMWLHHEVFRSMTHDSTPDCGNGQEMTDVPRDPTAMIPALALDPFADEFLSDPYAYHQELRSAGSVVWLSRYGVFAMARYKEVSAALKDWQGGSALRILTGKSPGVRPVYCLRPTRRCTTKLVPSSARTVAVGALRELRLGWQAIAESLVEELVSRGEFDAITDLAEVFPLKVFPDAVGLQESGRHNMLPYGSLAFNASGGRI
jgi:4-methoxybenzoate monooxygenase (O-demethylating)